MDLQEAGGIGTILTIGDGIVSKYPSIQNDIAAVHVSRAQPLHVAVGPFMEEIVCDDHRAGFVVDHDRSSEALSPLDRAIRNPNVPAAAQPDAARANIQ